MLADSSVQKFHDVSVVIHLANRRHDSSVMLAVAWSAFSPICEGWNLNSGNYLFTTDTK